MTSPAIGNKGLSERIITAPFSPLGHDTHVGSKNATCMALPTNQPIAPTRNTPRRCAKPIRSRLSTRSTITR